MGFCCVRFQPLKVRQPALTLHHEGSSRPPEALGRPEWDGKASLCLVDRSAKADALLDRCKSVPRRGRPGCETVAAIFSGPPPFDSSDAWPKERVLRWAKDSLRWLSKRTGKAAIRRADLHLDERSPHLHVEFLPVSKDELGPKLSWRAAQNHLAGGKISNRREQMRVIQTSYFLAAGQPYGLLRGRDKRKTGATHEEPDRIKGLQDRARDATNRQHEAESRARQTRESSRISSKKSRSSLARAKGQARAIGWALTTELMRDSGGRDRRGRGDR